MFKLIQLTSPFMFKMFVDRLRDGAGHLHHHLLLLHLRLPHRVRCHQLHRHILQEAQEVGGGFPRPRSLSI